MIFSFRRLLGVASLLGPLMIAPPCSAQDIATAEALFNRGAADMQAGRYESACKAIAESQRLDPRPGTLFSLATCESKWGRIASASTRFGDYLTLYDRLSPEQQARQGERAKVAREERSKMAADIPQLTLSLAPGAPSGTVVKRDGVVLSEAALGVGLPVDPGEHAVSTQVSGGPVWEQRISIAKGEKKQVSLEVKLAPSPVASSSAGKPGPDTAAPPSKWSTQRTVGLVVGGVGLVGVALGAVFGVQTLGKIAEVNDNNACTTDSPPRCTQQGYDLQQDANKTANISNVSFAVGGAALIAGVVVFVTAPSGKTTKSAGLPVQLSPMVGTGAKGLLLQGAF